MGHNNIRNWRRAVCAVAITAVTLSGAMPLSAKNVKASKKAGTEQTVSGVNTSKSGKSVKQEKNQELKYIFYFIGDGMGLNPVLAGEAFNRSVLGNDTPLLMLQFPVTSYATSHSASSDVTDSAAGGTALATGHKTRNGMVGMDADSVAVQSIASKLFNQGWGVGLVTTGAPDDATPASFYAHQPNRGMYYEIGAEAAKSGYQFIAGSNWRGLRDKKGNDTGLAKMFADNDVVTVRGLDALRGVDSRRVVLLNTDSVHSSTIGYTVDSIPGVLTLPGMTEACLKHLQKVSPDRFFMMVEEGDIDHSAHSNDGGGVVHEVLTLQNAIRVAYDFYLQHPDETLIVVSADHNTGGMALGNMFCSYMANLKTIPYQRISKDRFSDWCRKLLKDKTPVSWDDMKKELTDKFGYWTAVPLTKEQEEYIRREFDRTFVQGDARTHETMYNSSNNFVEAVFDTFNDIAGIGFTTERHTGDFVPVFAIGVDSSRFQGLHDNTDLPKLIYEISQNDK